MIYNGLYTQILAIPAANALLSANKVDPKTAVFFGAANKQPPARFVVINLIDAPPAASTLNGVSDLIDAEIQFDAYAESQIAARQLWRAVRDGLKGYGGALSDGTVIQFVDVTTDRDAGYEVGAESYVYRTLGRMRALYTEAA